MNIEIPLQPKQRELLEAVEDSDGPVVIGIGGSKGSAKSHGMRSVMLLRRLKYAHTAGLIVRRKWKQLRENMLEGGFFKQWPFMREWWQESKKTIYLPNGSRIVFGYAEHAHDIDDFQGHEYMDVMPDEATRFTEIELVKLNETRRWTGKFGGQSIPDRLCKTVLGMNPGGPGHAYIRRIMYKKDYKNKERASDYKFIAAYAWDNVEWCRSALQQRNMSEKQFYALSNQDRFDFFVKNTQRGHELDNLPYRLRVGWLLGQWDEFAGQFFDCFDEAKHKKPCQPERHWHPRWLGIDWGFQHELSCHWFARDKRETRVYREYVANQRSARSQAQEIVDRTPADERKLIDAIYLSPDAFQSRSEQDSFAQLMGEVFERYGMPYPIPADDDRKHGAQACYDALDSGEMLIDPSCRRLLEVIPMVCTEEDDPEEIEKFDGDDPFDSWRYGVKSRLREAHMPVAEKIEERLNEYAKARGKENLDELDTNVVAQLHRRAQEQERRSRLRRRGGLGRVWRPQPAGA